MRALRLLVLAGGLLALAAVSAWGQGTSNQDGDLIVSFDGALSPNSLPREALAPVSVRVAGDVRSASGAEFQLPQLRQISVAINRQGRLFDRGLPSCPLETIEPASEAGALAACRAALVGSGSVRVQVRIPGQEPFLVRARLLAFNGPRRNGHKLIYAQAYSRKPPGAFILTFRVSNRPGLFGTVLSTTLPLSSQGWAYLTHFDMTLHRTYVYRGRHRSYVSAACRAPAGFESALFPFARATYGFADGRSLSTSASGRCRVAH